MEPTDLNIPRNDGDGDDTLDSLLRCAAPEPLPDDGFSHRVLAGLPSSPAGTGHLRTLFLVGGGLAGTALAAARIVTSSDLGGARTALADHSAQFSSAFAQTTDPAQVSTLALALVVAGASLFYAFRPRPAHRRSVRF